MQKVGERHAHYVPGSRQIGNTGKIPPNSSSVSSLLQANDYVVLSPIVGWKLNGIEKL